MEKINNLTGLRAFAALWVVLVHFSSNTGVTEFLDLGPFIHHGSLGVDVFFVLSGLVITLNYLQPLGGERPFGPKFIEYLAKRFARLYPLHLATFLMTVTCVGIAVHRHYEFKNTVTFSGFTALLNLLLIHAWGFTDKPSWNGVSWSISAEWFAYLFVFPCCAYLLERVSLLRVALLVAASWSVFAGTVVLYLHESITDLISDGVLRIIPEFAAGYLLVRLSAKVSGGGDSLTAIGLVLIASVTFLPGSFELLVLPAVMVLLLGLYRGGRLSDALFGNRLAVFLGEISFAIYLVHPFIQAEGDEIMRTRASWVNSEHAIPVLLTEVFAVLLLATATYYVVERPSRRWVMGVFHKSMSRLRPGARAETATA